MDNYMKKILKMQQRGKIAPGQLSNVLIQHDDWCRKLTRPGGLDWECNCNPDITVTPAENAEEFVNTAIALSSHKPKN